MRAPLRHRFLVVLVALSLGTLASGCFRESRQDRHEDKQIDKDQKKLDHDERKRDEH